MNPPGVLVLSPIEMSPDRSESGSRRDSSNDVQAVLHFDRHIAVSIPEKYGRTDPISHSGREIIELSSELSSLELADNLRREQSAHAITRAILEQGRRNTDCARDCLTSLLYHLDQPCAVIERNGAVIQWNSALAAFSGIDGQEALGKTLPELFGLQALHPLAHALQLRNSAATYMPETWSAHTLAGPIELSSGVQAAHVTLIPRYHVPGSLESIILLLEKS